MLDSGARGEVVLRDETFRQAIRQIARASVRYRYGYISDSAAANSKQLQIQRYKFEYDAGHRLFASKLVLSVPNYR